MVAFDTAIEKYLSVRSIVLEDSSLALYNRRLKPIITWSKENNISLDNFGEDELIAFVSYVFKLKTKNGEKYSTVTTRNIINVTIVFLYWCLKNKAYKGIMSRDLKEAIEDLELPKQEERGQPLYSVSAVQALRNACKTYKSDELRIRNDTLVCLLFDTGLRANECTGLKKHNVHFSESDKHGYIFIGDRKNKVDLKVGMGNDAEKMMKKYLAVRPVDADIDEFFVGYRKSKDGDYIPLGYSGLHGMIKDLIKRAKLDEHDARRIVHQFRHSSAVTYLKGGGTEKGLQLRLGHKDPRSTMKYLKAYKAEDELENGISPLDNLNRRNKRK